MQDRRHRLRQRAPIHAAAGSNYLADAQFLLQRDRPESAASLLYEAAKSSINAVANLRGENPGHTDHKTRALQAIMEQHPTPELLQDGWDATRKLHIHCDQHHLGEEEFADSLLLSIAFARQMLALFHQQSRN